MKRNIIITLFFLATGLLSGNAQVVETKIIDNGSNGPYKAIAAKEESLPDYVVYRPENISAASRKEGKLPVLVFANGGCSNTSITHEKVLSAIASHGYIVIAIGPLQMKPDEREPKSTDASMLTEAIDWISAKSKDKKSDYYKKVDPKKIASGGQSCGGAQVLAVASDSRVKSYMMFNSGIGDMTMARADKESLKQLHNPIIYIVGGPSDVAYKNALLDYDRISHVPVAFTNLEEGGHMGTFGDQYGGSFARMALSWLDWQLKEKKNNAGIFLENELSSFPGWTVKSKNF